MTPLLTDPHAETMVKAVMKLLTLIILVIATGLPGYADESAVSTIRATTYYGEPGADADSVDIPVRSETIYRITLFDRVVSHRNNKKARIDFELPGELVENSGEMEIVLEAYNDDARYARTIWFEIDGVGGYIGVVKVDDQQYRGRVVLGAREQRLWRINLSKVHLSSNDEEQTVNVYNMLKQPGPHTMSCWISTYEKYGPNSWVSIGLNIK